MPSSSRRSQQQLQDLVLDGDVERGRRLVGEQQLGLSWRARWRSSRAGACRRRTGADSRRAARAAAGMPTRSSSSTARARRAAARRARCAPTRFSSICGPTGRAPGSAPSSAPGRSSRSRAAHRRAARASRQRRAGRARCQRTRPLTAAAFGAAGRRIDAQGDALARAGFADQAQHLARPHVEVDAVDGAQRAARASRR